MVVDHFNSHHGNVPAVGRDCRTIGTQDDRGRVSGGFAAGRQKLLLAFVASRLDRALLYTAITRARLRAVLIGRQSQLDAAVRGEPRAAAWVSILAFTLR